MAILYPATLTPSKIELLAAYLRKRPALADTTVADYSQLGAYRFDDPAGTVGVEAHLVDAGTGGVFHVPLTYRGAPLPGADPWLIGTMQHSVLGRRWIYHACGDPVFVQELVRAILTGGSEVEQFIETDDGPVVRPSTASVRGSGTPGASVPVIPSVEAATDGDTTVVHAGGIEIVVRHVLGGTVGDTTATLSGTWPGMDTPVVLAFVR